MSWWADKLNPPTPPQPQSQPNSAGPWWQQARQQPEQHVPATQVYGANPPVQSPKSTGPICPKCSSIDYAKVGTQIGPRGAFDVMRCFDCGYPVENRESGASGMRVTDVPQQASRQVSTGGTTNNYNPQNPIAGRIA